MSEPPIRQAINFTQDTLVARAASYRNLVVIISLSGCGLLFTTLITWNLKLVLGICWLLPLVNAWLWLDARRVRRWSDRVLEICAVGQLDIEVFRATLLHLRYLPQATLAGMLDMLPLNKQAPELKMQAPTDTQLQAALVERTYSISTWFGILGCILLMIGLIFNSWLWLLGLITCTASSRIAKWLAEKRLKPA